MKILYEPGVIDWEIRRGDPYFTVIEYIDHGEPLNLSRYKLRGMIRVSPNAADAVDVPINIIDALNGKFEIDFNSEFTKNLGKAGREQNVKYDIQIEGDDFSLTIIEGNINVSGDYTY